MPVEADSSTGAGCFLSVRSSCDRCRVQKLKCSVLTGSGACERCTRAKLPCVFGRRTRPKRRSSNDEEQQAKTLATPNTSPVAQALPLAPFSSATPLATTASSAPSTTALAMAPPVEILLPSTMAAATQGGYQPHPGAYMPLAGPGDSAAPHTEPNFHYVRSWDNLFLLQDSFTDVLENNNSEPDSYDQTQFGFDVADMTMFGSGQLDLARWSSQLGSLTASTCAMDIPSAATNSKAGGHGPSNTAVFASQRLMTLISEIQQRLRNLEESPWHAGRARSLDDYPIGSVVQLSHQFSSLACLALSGGIGAGSVMMMDDDDDDDSRAMANEGSSSSSSLSSGDSTATKDEDQDERKAKGANMLNLPTILLLLSGHMWLVRIFDTVLGHFHKHLNQTPTRRYDNGGGGPNSSGNSNSAALAGRTLRLGELQWANGALDLQKIHMAVSMLLDALHDVEVHMGRGGGMVRDLAVALLLNNDEDLTRCRPGDGDGDGDGEDGRHGEGLGRRMTALKELLREKMGL